jgi:chromosomal replication initiator protein
VLHLSRHDLLSSSRAPRVTRARHLAMYLTRELTGLSLAQIARGFGRDHSTVMHGIRRVSSNLEPGSALHQSLDEARALLDTGDKPP